MDITIIGTGNWHMAIRADGTGYGGTVKALS